MTITFNGYKVTANKQTMNYLSILASEAYHNYKNEGYEGLANEADKFSQAIFDELSSQGYYN